MPRHVVEKITDALNDHGKAVRGADILVMGVAYKPEVGDVRESPALDVIELLIDKGARVSYHDPFVPRVDAHQWNTGVAMDSTALDPQRLAAADCVVVLTHHEAFNDVDLASAARLIVDTRNAVKSDARHVYRLGMPNPGPAPSP